MKTLPVLFFKSHIDTYTRKDGSVVNAHDDKRTKREADQKAGNGGKDWRDEENWHTRTQEKMKTHSEDELRFIHKDANEAAETGEKSGFDSKKTGKYRDEAHYASMELKKRQDGKKNSAFEDQKERALDDVRRWANKEHDQYGADWIRKNAPAYLVERWGITHDHASDTVKKWFPPN